MHGESILCQFNFFFLPYDMGSMVFEGVRARYLYVSKALSLETLPNRVVLFCLLRDCTDLLEIQKNPHHNQVQTHANSGELITKPAHYMDRLSYCPAPIRLSHDTQK